LVGEYAPEDIEHSVEFALADGIVQLVYEAHEPFDRRWLRVVKMRGAGHLAGKHSFRITADGLRVFPRLETIAPEAGAHVAARASSGVPKLDELMGGGLPAADATAVLGPSGCGKTALSLRFIAQGLAEGERCVYASFQENADQLTSKAASFGWDFEGALESGQLLIHHVPHGELDLDTLGAVARRELSDGAVRRVVLDSLAELVVAARETERFPAYARSLVGFIRAGGASVLVTSEMTALGPEAEPIGGLSFLFHNVLLLRYIEIESETRRALSILKMRDSDHEKGVYQFDIDEHGFEVMNKLEGVTGVLGWSALRTRNDNDRPSI
ncbi:MAG: ATPase domain-containing protein, partial [Actinomycetota bacterium]